MAGAGYDNTGLNGVPGGGKVPYSNTPPYNQCTANGMNIGYSGDGNAGGNLEEHLTIAETTEDLVVLVVSSGVFSGRATRDSMPAKPDNTLLLGELDIRTQEKAQKMLERPDNAMVIKDKVRAHLGSLQNQAENTIANLNIQAENLHTAESRISNVDVATAMTEFVRSQILTQDGVTMLAQANNLPKMAMQLMDG